MTEVLHPYFGAWVMLVLSCFVFSMVLFLSNLVGKALAKKNTEKLKLTIYECGPEPSKQPISVSTHYYLFALLFILFDVEIIFMFPWAVDFKILGWFGFVEMIIFIALLALGFIYAWRKGALQWQNIR